jgi:hypothetical protein
MLRLMLRLMLGRVTRDHFGSFLIVLMFDV